MLLVVVRDALTESVQGPLVCQMNYLIPHLYHL